MSGALAGREFLKMSGSGNDFVFLDARHDRPLATLDAALIRRLCARGTGIGADGLVTIVGHDAVPFEMRYYNADGTLADLCGNATLCAARFAVEAGIVSPGGAETGFEFLAGTGRIRARVSAARPEIDLVPATDVRPDLAPDPKPIEGEARLGFVKVGVPHVVILCENADLAPVADRGPALRKHHAFPHGANVNFVSRTENGWRYRTWERGVEGETLACGTGAAACAVLLREWGEADGTVSLRTSSGSVHEATLGQDPGEPIRLKGEARLVFRGRIAEL